MIDPIEEVVVLPEPSFADLRALSKGETPAVKDDPKPAEEKPAVEKEASSGGEEPPATDPASDTGKEKQEPKDGQERDETGKFVKKTPGLEKRFRELTSEIRELKAKLSAKAEPGDASPKAEITAAKPTLKSYIEQIDAGKYQSYEEAQEAYTDAITDWKLDHREKTKLVEDQKRTAKEQNDQLAASFNQKVEAFEQKNPDVDFDALLQAFHEADFHGAVQSAIAESDVAAKLIQHLAETPGELDRLRKMTPLSAVRAIGKLEDKLSTPEPETTRKVSKAPNPPAKIDGGGSPAKALTAADLEKLPMKDFKKAYAALTAK